MNRFITSICAAFFIFSFSIASAQGVDSSDIDTSSTATSATTTELIPIISNPDSIGILQNAGPIVVPNEDPDNQVEFTRDLQPVTIFNIIAFMVATAVSLGLPAETIVLTLMIPVLATLLAFTKNVVGLPSLDMLVVIAFSIALLASSLLTGLLLLAVILLASMSARITLRRVRIMQLPKVSLSMMIVAVSVLFALFISAVTGLVAVESISIVPVLLLIILSERIVRLQFESSPKEVWFIVAVSLGVGVIGYYLLLSQTVRSALLNYPELILLLIPINMVIGRYFGLRLTEYMRFGTFIEAASKKER